MSTTQVTQITHGLGRLLEAQDIDQQDQAIIYSEVDTLEPMFGFDRGKHFEYVRVDLEDGRIYLCDDDATYEGKILITLPDQLDEFPRESDTDYEEEEEEEDADPDSVDE